MPYLSHISTLLFMAMVMAGFSATAAAQAGNYAVEVNGTAFDGTLLIDGGVNKVAVNGVVMQGWSWIVIDTDGDGKADDVRISEPGGGVLDLVDAGDASETAGTTHDGGQPYNPGGSPPHPNENGKWSR
jgi:hypothetical protein